MYLLFSRKHSPARRCLRRFWTPLPSVCHCCHWPLAHSMVFFGEVVEPERSKVSAIPDYATSKRWFLECRQTARGKTLSSPNGLCLFPGSKRGPHTVHTSSRGRRNGWTQRLHGLRLCPPPTVICATVLAAVVAGVAAAFRRHRLQPLATCSVVPAPLTAGPYCMAAAGATGEYIPASTCKASLTDRNAAQHARRFALVLATLVKRSYPQTHACTGVCPCAATPLHRRSGLRQTAGGRRSDRRLWRLRFTPPLPVFF